MEIQVDIMALTVKYIVMYLGRELNCFPVFKKKTLKLLDNSGSIFFSNKPLLVRSASNIPTKAEKKQCKFMSRICTNAQLY